MTTLLSFSELEIRRRNRVRNVDLITENEREIKKKRENQSYTSTTVSCVSFWMGMESISAMKAAKSTSPIFSLLRFYILPWDHNVCVAMETQRSSLLLKKWMGNDGHGVNLSHEGSKVNISHLLCWDSIYFSFLGITMYVYNWRHKEKKLIGILLLNGHVRHEGSKVNISHLLSAAEILYTSLWSQCMCSNNWQLHTKNSGCIGLYDCIGSGQEREREREREREIWHLYIYTLYHCLEIKKFEWIVERECVSGRYDDVDGSTASFRKVR